MSKPFEILSLFPSSYSDVLALQLELVQKRAADEIPDTLILTEHAAVFTAGRRVAQESLPTTEDIPVVEVTRGGDVTYHGPGQLVGYWIRKLVGADRDLHAHLRLIEELLIKAVARLGLDAGRKIDLTGVWAEEKKIASIGVAVRNWVTFHGFALNIDVDPGIYKLFRPCGLGGDVMSDLTTLLAASIPRDEVVRHIQAEYDAFYA